MPLDRGWPDLFYSSDQLFYILMAVLKKMISHPGKRLGLNKRLIFVFVSLWMAYAISPVFAGRASASYGLPYLKDGPNIFFCEFFFGGCLTKKKSRGVKVLRHTQQANKEDNTFNAPAFEGGPTAGNTVFRLPSFTIKKISLRRNIKNIRRCLWSINLTHSPPLS